MKTVDDIREIIRQNQDVLAERYGIKIVGIFGSYTRGEQRRGSDLDLLADMLHPVSLLELVGAEIYLADILGVKVDIVPKRNVRAELQSIILNEAVAV